MTQPVRLKTAAASPKVAPSQASPQLKLQVLQLSLATDVRTPTIKVKIKADKIKAEAV